MKIYLKEKIGNPELFTGEVQRMLEQEFGSAVSVRVIDEFRQEHDLRRRQSSWQKSGAAEILIALALSSRDIAP